MYIHKRKEWPIFFWDTSLVLPVLAEVRNQQGRLLGRVTDWGFDLKEEASLESIVRDVVTSSEIEGEMLPLEQVQSSVARKLGVESAGVVAVLMAKQILEIADSGGRSTHYLLVG